MIIEKAPCGGIFWKLEKAKRGQVGDWQGDTNGLHREVKKLKTWEYNPPEKGEGWWFIGGECVTAFLALKKKHIDDVVRMIKSDRAAGWKPLPRRGGRFARKRVV